MSSRNVQDVFASVLVSNAALAKSAVTPATLSREVSKIWSDAKIPDYE